MRSLAGIVDRTRIVASADLEHASGLLDHFFDQLVFIDRQRQWLFAVYVFAGQHRFDSDLGVPVIGRRDHDGINVFTDQDFAIVLVRVWAFPLSLFRFSTLAPNTLASTSTKAAKSANLNDLLVIVQP